MNMNLPVLTSMVKKPRAKINPSPIFSLSWVNFRLFKMGKGKTNTGTECQTHMRNFFCRSRPAAEQSGVELTQNLANYIQCPGHLLQMGIGKG